MDITGGHSLGLAKDKMNKMNAWINEQQKEVKDFKLHGVVLAPLANGISDKLGQVVLVCGCDGQRHLGGLAQVLRWFTS